MIEIDEVLVPMIALSLSTGHSAARILRLTSSFSTAVSTMKSHSASPSSPGAGTIRAERRLALALADRVLGDLARHVAVDGGDAGLDAVFRHVVERDLEAGERAYMGDAAAHLTGADDAYPVNVHVRSLALRAIPKNAPSGSTAKRAASPLSGVPYSQCRRLCRSWERHRSEPDTGSAPAAFVSVFRMILSEKGATFRRHAINLT